MESKQVESYSKQYGLSCLLENIKVLKPKNTYYLFEKEYASTVYSLLNFGFKKGYLSKAVNIEVSFFYQNEDIIAFKVTSKDILKYSGKIKFFNEHKNKLNEIIKQLEIENISEEDRMVLLSKI